MIDKERELGFLNIGGILNIIFRENKFNNLVV